MEESPRSGIRVLSAAEDQPRNGRGILIPQNRPGRRHSTRRQNQQFWRQFNQGAATAFAVALLAVVGITGYGAFSQATQVAAPVVTIMDPYTQTATELEYGPQVALSKPNLYLETRDAFVAEGLTFVEADLTRNTLRYFDGGVLTQTAEILSVAETGSWWDTPSGLYQVEEMHERQFSSVSQAYLPHVLRFGGNFAVHGLPVYPDGEPVSQDFSGGGIRVSNESAQALAGAVAVGTPVLVHQSQKPNDTFVYEPQVPELETPHYFIADIENSTILAASDLDARAPIASVTKLMTAVVAAEELDLDGRVRVTEPTFVTSLIPRLSDRGSVSMYSLLQLLLVESSNEAAEVIAGELGRDAFIDAMNAKARQLGMVDTTFVDPSGLGDGNVSSLGDLYKLTRYIYDDRAFILEITANERVPNAYVGDEFGGLINFNEIEDLDNFAGGKVGETRAAGQTSVSLHKVTLQGEERTLVIILLGSEQRTADIQALIQYIEDRF